jgi:2,3-dihydroxybiphenyl 1,2-dioxygenase
MTTQTAYPIAQLGYLGFEVSDLDAWERFSTEILGLEVVNRSTQGFGLRMDDHAQRFYITHGQRDDVSAFGWQLEDASALQEMVMRLRSAGLDVKEGDGDARGVAALYRFRDPSGHPSELYFGASLMEEPFRSDLVPSGFVTGQLGMGHTAISATDKATSYAFYRQLMGFGLSDHIVCEYFGHPVDMVFMHTNARHHTLAFGGRQQKRIHHFLLEANDIDDVGAAFDRAVHARVPIMNTLGRHPNDHMFSFYGFTPSGFQFEFGWGGRLIDDATWVPQTYDRISDWGHHPPGVVKGVKR